MKNLKYIYLLILIFFSCVNNIFLSDEDFKNINGQTNYFSLSGRVVDKTNTPIMDVKVYVGNYITTTDSSGNFNFSKLPSNLFKIFCKKDGYIFIPENGSDEINLKDNTTDFNFLGLVTTDIDASFDGKLTYIYDIQGEGHTSSYISTIPEVQSIIGIVTAAKNTKYETGANGKGQYIKEVFIQSLFSDLNYKTSDGIKMITSYTADIKRGDLIYIKKGMVEESKLNKSVGSSSYQENLTRTQLKVSDVDGNIKILKRNFKLPDPVIIGSDGRIPPSKEYASNNFSFYNPQKYGLDFWESLEGMIVRIRRPSVVGPTSNVTYSDDYAIKEIYVVSDYNKYGDNKTIKNGLVIGENYSDFNPEIITLAKFEIDLPDLNVGDTFNGDIVGVVDYSYKKFKVMPIDNLPSYNSTTVREVANIKKDKNNLLIATYNIENYTLDTAENGDKTGEKTNSIAKTIVTNLLAPDIIALIEVQDESGSLDDGVVSSDMVLNQLINKIKEISNNEVEYQYIYINPIYGTEGGEPVGNIRNVLLYNPKRVTFIQKPEKNFVENNIEFKNSLSWTSVNVINNNGVPELTLNPGRIEPLNPDFSSTRKSLVAEFLFNNEKIFVIVNHLSAKGGDNPLQGNIQPPVRLSDEKRKRQVQVIRNFTDKILSIDKKANIIILGDLNDFHFADTLKPLNTNLLYNLIYDIPQERRYTYNYEGNSQILDNIIVSNNLKIKKYEIDIVHINSDFHFLNSNSDHDPVLLSVNFDSSSSLGLTPSISEGYPVINESARSINVKLKSNYSARGYLYPIPLTDNYNYTFKEIKNGILNNGTFIQREVFYLPENFEVSFYIKNLLSSTQYKLLYFLESPYGYTDGKIYNKLFTTTTPIPINYAFTDSDFENDVHNTSWSLKPSMTRYLDGFGIDNSRCLKIEGEEDANFYVFTAKYNLNPKGSYKKLTIMIKGYSSKSLLLQFKSSGATRYFNFGNVNSNKTITSSGTASYTGVIDLIDWAKVSMDISGITLDSDPISIKGGKDCYYEIFIDNIAYED